MSKVIDAPDLDEVVSNLLIRLNEMINQCKNEEALLQLTESVAKLSASMRNNNQFGAPLSAEEKAKQMEQDIFKDALEGNTNKGDTNE